MGRETHPLQATRLRAGTATPRLSTHDTKTIYRSPVTPRPARSDLLPGTLDMLVLQTLSLAPLHGYGIAQHIARISEDALKVEQGSLYPALERLQAAGWIISKWGTSPTGRRARYYTLTVSGRRKLGQEISAFDTAVLAIARVLGREEPA